MIVENDVIDNNLQNHGFAYQTKIVFFCFRSKRINYRGGVDMKRLLTFYK